MSPFRFASFSENFAPWLGTILAVRTLREYAIMGGAVLLVTGAVMVWVVIFRRSRKRRHGHRRHRHSPTESSLSKGAGATKTVGAPGGRRHRQRRQYPRKPTLAETGGLPPLRGPQPPPPELHY
jgi:hypothetical protein